MSNLKFRISKLSIICLLSLMFFTKCNEPVPYEMYNPIMTAQNERDLGDRLSEIIKGNSSVFPILDRQEYPDLYRYLDIMMNMVLINTKIKNKFNWEIFVYHDDMSRNIYTLPGGKIVITTGMLKYLRGEYQLFALVAHEAFYTDRKDQSSESELSVIMRKYKEEFAKNVGTKIFIDLIQNEANTEQDGIDMIIHAKDVLMDQWDVFSADDFAMQTICENYLYASNGIKEVIIDIEQQSIDDFQWLLNRPPGASSWSSANEYQDYSRDLRIDNFDTWISDCGSENIQMNNNNYADIIQMLP